MNSKSLLLALLFASISYTSSAQGFLRAKDTDIVNGNEQTVILRGMGLGGWMLQEGYMLQTASFANAQHKIRSRIEELIGEEHTAQFYEAWLQNHVTKTDIDSLKSWGFNSVRLPMHYNLFTLPVEMEPVSGENTWLDTGFELTDQLIQWCAENEMYVVLDLHAAPGGQGYDEGISDYDPSRPSLWESNANREKTVALWKKIAERYAEEEWVGAYDLLNEPNWNLDGNVLLRQLYEDIRDAIRSVDTNHMLIIEGNWFANDFTGLTPPFDDNMAYGPHKYWSYNDINSIEWVLDIRETYNVPLYFGESGENSNVWFRDAIALFENNGIGWAWWPMKKVGSISGPLSVPKSNGYQSLLDYWEGNGPRPDPEDARSALMDLAAGFNIANCEFNPDVIDAMFRQVYSDETLPYKLNTVPGVIYPTDYDLGVIGSAYNDSDAATYHVSSGSFTAWNNGWSYRNDGVDIQPTEDNVNTNGYNVGWLGEDEWMQYSIEVEENAVYDVRIRVASGQAGGSLKLSVGEADISGVVDVPFTGGWQNWQTLYIPRLILCQDDKNLRLEVVSAGFNLGGMEFIKIASSAERGTRFSSAHTVGTSGVVIALNKPLIEANTPRVADFKLFSNNEELTITSVLSEGSNRRLIMIQTDAQFKPGDIIKVSYTGLELEAVDGVKLGTFSLREVQNLVEPVYRVPGWVQAEDYMVQVGIQTENTTDLGGGLNIGYLDAGDYADYKVDVAITDTYEVSYRYASESATGRATLQLVDESGNTTDLHAATFYSTGGWQTWTNVSYTADLEQGEQVLRLKITSGNFNLNWMQFSGPTPIEDFKVPEGFDLWPNPANGGHVFIRPEAGNLNKLRIRMLDMRGQQITLKTVSIYGESMGTLDISSIPNGMYILQFLSDDGSWSAHRLFIDR